MKITLGQYLASIRADRKMTLRQVEEATDKEVSNAYLSQSKTTRSSNRRRMCCMRSRRSTASTTADLMEMAGHITPIKKPRPRIKGTEAWRHFADHNLTAEEEAELIDYLKYIRTREATE